VERFDAAHAVDCRDRRITLLATLACQILMDTTSAASSAKTRATLRDEAMADALHLVQRAEALSPLQPSLLGAPGSGPQTPGTAHVSPAG
jgi:hypothetical protein